jgi:hypothetical protein
MPGMLEAMAEAPSGFVFTLRGDLVEIRHQGDWRQRCEARRHVGCSATSNGMTHSN